MSWREVGPDGTSQREKAHERAERVLAWPGIAVLLTKPPLSLPDPRMWSGYIPPAEHQGKPNSSSVRAQLVAICNMVLRAEQDRANNDHTDNPVAPPLIDEAGLQRLHILLNEYGITDREDKLLYLRAETGRELASSKELTAEEAATLIPMLSQLIRDEARADARKAANPEGAGRPEGGPDGDYRPHDHPRPARRDRDGGPDYTADYDGSAEDEYDTAQDRYGGGSHDLPPY